MKQRSGFRNFSRISVAVVLLVMFAAFLWEISGKTVSYELVLLEQSDTVPISMTKANGAIVKRSIAQPDGAPSAHAATIVRTPDGKLLAAWFAGSREGAADVRILFSVFDGTSWSKTRDIANASGTGKDVMRRVHRIGNPVLFLDEKQALHLFYVTTDVGGWSLSNINHKVSADGGNTWSEAVRLRTEPLLNISTLVRNQAMNAPENSVILPVYFECGAKYPELLKIRGGQVAYKWSYPEIAGAIQPVLVSTTDGRIFMYCRDSYSVEKKIRFAELNTAGAIVRSANLNIANSDAAVAAIRVGNAVVLVCNPTDNGSRGQLSMFASSDGQNFKKIVDIENSPGEFSYPTLVQNGDMINILYTYDRKHIEHAQISVHYVLECLKGSR